MVKGYAFVLALGLALELIMTILFPSFSGFLDSAVEFSTPVTSWRSIEEGIFLLKHNIDPYDGGVVYHPPVLIKLFSQVKDLFGTNTTSWRIASGLIFQIADILTSIELIQISKKFLREYKNPKQGTYTVLIAIFYTFNPIKILSVLSNSSIIFSNLFIASTLYSMVVLENVALAAASLAMGTYLSYNPCFLLFPFIGMVINLKNHLSPCSSIIKSISVALIPFIATFTGLLYCSYIINNNNWNFLMATYGTNIFFTKINPNLGLWWYFFIEIFEFFSKFFIGVFNIYNLVYILPLTIRFQNSKFSNLQINNKYLIFPFVLSYGFVVLTKAYPTLNDLGFICQLLLLLVFQNDLKILKFLRYPIVSILLVIHAVILSPIFYYLWIFSGSGNSNFFYAINLVYSLGLGFMLIDFIWSYLSLEYLFEKNNGKEVDYDAKLRLTQI
ncbi:GPI-anchor transamidase subunit [Saccharomycopsis crataegensis]|uniref:GPI-anchor transamidase subunit n=1 Tax=Saccharomycopsis crataegensis TaxID=43959 RepID=A0AAV5QH84_9ASCO|nr:GPI-anchor transamidase subunit [Saccharomycopsis crataegensis]